VANVLGLQKVIAALRSKAAKHIGDEGRKVACIVGYTANYALFVHENLEMRLKGVPRPSGLGVYWGPNGGPKFLEGPFRMYQSYVAQMVKDALAEGRTLGQGLLLAGLFIQRESQAVVPVEYGDLRRSAFTILEKRD